MAQSVFIVDDILAAPGQGKEVLAAYKARYVPAAQARGMALERILVCPPVWMDDQSNRVMAIWTVAGVGGWWGMTAQSRYDPQVSAFWAELSALIVSRQRHFATADEAVDEMCNV